MRGLSLVDLLVILAVLAVLILAGRRDAVRYAGRAQPAAPTPTTRPEG